MNNIELAKKFTAFLEESDLQSASEMLSEDFRAAGPTAEITKEQFIGSLSLILSPFPNHRFNFSNFIEKEQDSITCTIQEQGTHKNILDLNPLGIPIRLPPTGKSFSLPETSMDFTFHDGKIIAIKEAHNEGSGLKGILDQLGIKLP
jgi:hypothetical protein